MGRGWEWLIMPVILLAVIAFVVLGNWWAAVWAFIAGLIEGRLWQMRLRKERLEKEVKK